MVEKEGYWRGDAVRFPWQLGQVGEEHGARSVVDQPNGCDCSVRVVEGNLDGVARSGQFDRRAGIARARFERLARHRGEHVVLERASRASCPFSRSYQFARCRHDAEAVADRSAGRDRSESSRIGFCGHQPPSTTAGRTDGRRSRGGSWCPARAGHRSIHRSRTRRSGRLLRKPRSRPPSATGSGRCRSPRRKHLGTPKCASGMSHLVASSTGRSKVHSRRSVEV